MSDHNKFKLDRLNHFSVYSFFGYKLNIQLADKSPFLILLKFLWFLFKLISANLEARRLFCGAHGASAPPPSVYTNILYLCILLISGDEGFRDLSQVDPLGDELLIKAMDEDKSDEWFNKKGRTKLSEQKTQIH